MRRVLSVLPQTAMFLGKAPSALKSNEDAPNDEGDSAEGAGASNPEDDEDQGDTNESETYSTGESLDENMYGSVGSNVGCEDYLPTDEDFSDNADNSDEEGPIFGSDDEEDDGWMKRKTQKPTTFLKRMKLILDDDSNNDDNGTKNDN